MSVLARLGQELRLWLTALEFLTRIPVPGWTWAQGWSPAQLNACARHFPTVGAAIGVVLAAVLIVTSQWWPSLAAAALTIGAGLFLTGAFHEDGLGDTCDGLGGMVDRDRALAIMKDSRVGSYATVALWTALSLKLSMLSAIASWPATQILAIVVASHALSRLAALYVMSRLPYMRDDDQSRIKPIAQGISRPALAGATGFAIAASLGVGLLTLLVTFATCLVVAETMVRFLKRRLGGYVGDTLGATQQLTELAVLLSGWVVLEQTWKFA